MPGSKNDPSRNSGQVDINVLMKTIPKLTSLANTRHKQRKRRILGGLTESQKDVMCHCLHWMGKYVPRGAFKDSERAKIENERDMLQLLCDLRQCSGNSRQEAKRERILKQVGRGFSHYLRRGLPLVRAQVQQVLPDFRPRVQQQQSRKKKLKKRRAENVS